MWAFSEQFVCMYFVIQYLFQPVQVLSTTMYNALMIMNMMRWTLWTYWLLTSDAMVYFKNEYDDYGAMLYLSTRV